MDIEIKQSGAATGSALGDIFSSIYDTIANLFRSADVPDTFDSPGRATDMALMREIVVLQDRLERAKEQYDAITSRADQVSADMQSMTDAINTITSNLSTRYASSTAAALAARISQHAQEWDQLTGQAGTLAQEVLNLQREVDAKEREIGAKSAPGAHGFYR